MFEIGGLLTFFIRSSFKIHHVTSIQCQLKEVKTGENILHIANRTFRTLKINVPANMYLLFLRFI